MNVGPSPSAPQAKPPAAARTRPDLLDLPPSSPPLFWDVVNDRPVEPDGAAGVPLPDQAVFAAQTAVGDAAVRFEARPIVAPSAEALPTTAADCLAERQAGRTAAMPDAETPVTTLAVLVKAVVGQFAAAAPGNPAASTIGHTAPNEQAPMATADGAAVAMPAPPSSRRGSRAAPTRAAGSPLPATPIRAALERGPSARIAAFGDEIRIMIRGVALSTDDAALLERIARETLGASPMADRAVRVIGSRRR